MRPSSWRYTLALAAGMVTAAAQNAWDMPYKYNLTANSPLLTFSSQNGVSDFNYDRSLSRMRCNVSDCDAAYVQFAVSGKGFCLTGDLPQSVQVTDNPGSSGTTFSDVSTDGKTVCVGEDAAPGWKTYRVMGVKAVDQVTLNLITNTPPGYTYQDLFTQTFSFVVDGKPRMDKTIDCRGGKNPIITTIGETDSLHFDEGDIKIGIPFRATFMIVNGARGANMSQLNVNSGLLPFPMVGPVDLSSATTVQDAPLFVQSLNSTIYHYVVSLQATPKTAWSRGVNLTSVTFIGYDRSGSATTTALTSLSASISGTPTSLSASSFGAVTSSDNESTTGASDSKAAKAGTFSNVGAIAGGVVGAIVALVLLILLIFFLCRRRRSNGYNRHEDEWEDTTGVIRPNVEVQETTSSNFVTVPIASSVADSTESIEEDKQDNLDASSALRPPSFQKPLSLSASQSETTASAGSRPLSRRNNTNNSSSETSIWGGTPTDSSATATTSNTSDNSHLPIHDEDAGSIEPINPMEARELLPPMYNPAWRRLRGEEM